MYYIREYKEALEELETGVNKYPELAKAYCENRGNWEEHYLKFEDRFYDEEEEIEEIKKIPVKAKKIGRNEPCPCGSGKKYKKCCLNKDNVVSLHGANSTNLGTNSDDVELIQPKKGYAPGLCTTDGDNFVFVTAYYEVNDFEAAKEKIRSIPGLDFPEDGPDKIFAVWVVEKKEGPLPNVVYGNITLTSKRLALECQSYNRLDMGKDMLSKCMGKSIRHKLDKIQDIAKLMEEGSGKRGKLQNKKSQIPKDVQNQVVAQFMEDHYKRWVDEKIPALDGITPRQAVNDPELRDRLIWLIEDIENMEEQKRRNGEYFYDVNKIRKELGLEL